MAQQTDNSGVGVILGILVAVLLVVGGYFFIKNEGGVAPATNEVTNIDLPDVNVDAPDAANTEPAAQ
jgi:hypothetical protein